MGKTCEKFGSKKVAPKPIWGKFLRRSLACSSNKLHRVSVSGFPNFFMLAGPNTLPSGNSTLHGIECSAVYITRVLRGLWARLGGKGNTQTHTSLMPKVEAEVQFNKKIQDQIEGLIYTNQVNTWYINKETGKNTLIWPGTQFSFWWSRCISPVNWSDWVVGRV
jgi:hypothetical protein